MLEDLESKTWWKWWGWDCSVKVSVLFINVCPLKKPNFQPLQPLWHASLPSWSHFEHSSAKMGIPDNEPLCWTLYLSIMPTCSTSKFHLKMSQCSTWGVVMPTANLYAKDCMASSSCEKQKRFKEDVGSCCKVLWASEILCKRVESCESEVNSKEYGNTCGTKHS